jgi:hypothetical protein
MSRESVVHHSSLSRTVPGAAELYPLLRRRRRLKGCSARRFRRTNGRFDEASSHLVDMRA